MDTWHILLILLAFSFFVLWSFSRMARFQADMDNITLEAEYKQLLEALASPQPFTREDFSKEFIVYSVIHEGVVIVEQQSGYMHKMRFVPMSYDYIKKQDIKNGEERVFRGLFDEKGECEIPTLLLKEMNI